MVDLKELDKIVDQLLDSESSESLTNWLTNHRNRELTEILGKGSFVCLDNRNSSFVSMKTTIVYAGSYESIEENISQYAAA